MEEQNGLLFLIALGVVFVALMLTMVFCYLFIYADKILDRIKEKFKNGKIPTATGNRKIKNIPKRR